MKKKYFLIIIAVVLKTSFASLAQEINKTKWFQDAKFGIFIHWGLYSQIGYTEWCQNHFEIQADDYVKLEKTFNPKKYDPNAWAALIKASGAKYCVITSKHHEGFSMYDSRFSDYSIMNTPYKKDILAMLAKSLKSENINFGIYYSVMDWHHPDYLPRRYFDKRPAAKADISKYKEFFKNQVGELIDKYQPKLLWFDGDWENTHDSIETMNVVSMMKLKKPDLLFNNRLSRFSQGDFKTPENTVPATGLKDENGKALVWEVCHTINDSWGYDPFSNEFMSERDLIRLLVDIVSKGGNLLLNIGPKPDGSIQNEFVERLEAMGKWLAKNGESIYRTQASIFPDLSFYGRSTTKNNSIFLHVFMLPENEVVSVPLLKNTIKKIYTLKDSKTLKYTIENNQILITLNKNSVDINDEVIVIECDTKPELANVLPSYSTELPIELNCENIKIPLENKGLKAEQYFNKMRIRKWTAKQNDIEVEWNFETNTDQVFSIQLHAANALEKGGDCFIVLSIDGQEKIGMLKQRMPWTYVNKYIFDGIKLDDTILKAGKHKIKLKAVLKDDQQLVFEKIIFKPIK